MNGENQEKLSLGRWRHFKGGEYQVYGVAIHSETEEEYVVYRPLYGEGKLWIRPLSMWLEDVERDFIIRTVRECGDNKSEAAKRLGISRKTLHTKLKSYGLSSGNEE